MMTLHKTYIKVKTSVGMAIKNEVNGII